MSHQRGLTTSPPPSNKIPRQTSAELLDMQLSQLADNHSNGQIPDPFSKQQRPLPGSSNDPIFEWRKKAEVAESKVKFLEDKIKKLAVAVKADRDKSKLLMDELKQRAEAAEERASKLEEKLNELVEVLKVERSKASSVKTSVELKQIVEEQTSNKQVQQLQSKLNESEENLKREKSQSDQFKTKVEYLQAQLDEARDQLARQRSTYQPTSSGVFPGHQQKPRRNKLIGLYDFPGEKAEDLAFTEGEILTLLKKYSGGWWLAEKNGRVGRVPSNFVEEIQSSHRIVVRAKGSYRAEKKGDLGFVEGDMLQVIKTDDDWWVGEKDGKVGWVPSNFLEEIPAAQVKKIHQRRI